MEKDFYIKRIKNFLNRYETERKSFSMIFPFLMSLFVFLRRLYRKLKNKFEKIAKTKQEYKKFINVRHQSVLMRKLGDVDMSLQKNKIKNLEIASKKLDQLVINPGEIFSFWEIVGCPSYKKGYLDGILISRGKVKVGVGGGICQLGNLLYWMFLHTNVEIIERKHHSYDIFPDSGRVLPFSSGATLFYNYVDLKIKNTLDYPIQIKLWLDEKYLKGQILSDFPRQEKISVFEEFHSFVLYKNKFFRYNIIKKSIKKDENIKIEEISENFCPVLYEITEKEILEKGYKLIKIKKTDF
ncbi:vancomycin resistance protein [Candidatus Gracilibacteria bacterium]|nr:MAG: vancomycin resistance protein [Candidatus Gracilibacteria bacterium]